MALQTSKVESSAICLRAECPRKARIECVPVSKRAEGLDRESQRIVSVDDSGVKKAKVPRSTVLSSTDIWCGSQLAHASVRFARTLPNARSLFKSAKERQASGPIRAHDYNRSTIRHIPTKLSGQTHAPRYPRSSLLRVSNSE